jgi:hypothetical protein
MIYVNEISLRMHLFYKITNHFSLFMVNMYN